MSTLERIYRLQQNINSLIEERDKLILESDLSSLEKVRLLDSYGTYFRLVKNLEDPLYPYKDKWEKELKKKYPMITYFRIMDYLVGDKSRGTVDILYYVEDILSNLNFYCWIEDDEEDRGPYTTDDFMKILYLENTHGLKNLTYSIPVKEVIDFLCNWMIENKCKTLVIDW